MLACPPLRVVFPHSKTAVHVVARGADTAGSVGTQVNDDMAVDGAGNRAGTALPGVIHLGRFCHKVVGIEAATVVAAVGHMVARRDIASRLGDK